MIKVKKKIQKIKRKKNKKKGKENHKTNSIPSSSQQTVNITLYHRAKRGARVLISTCVESFYTRGYYGEKFSNCVYIYIYIYIKRKSKANFCLLSLLRVSRA